MEMVASGWFADCPATVPLGESLLRKLGATPDQIDRERDRVRGDLFGDPLSPDDALRRQLVTEEAAEGDKPRRSADQAETGEFPPQDE